MKPAWRTVTRESLRKQRGDILLVRQPSSTRSASWESWQSNFFWVTASSLISNSITRSADLRVLLPPSPPVDSPRRSTSGHISHPPVATSSGWDNWQCKKKKQTCFQLHPINFFSFS